MKALPLLELRCLAPLLCAIALPFPFACGNPAGEREIPAGWDLSATLAFFRNLPLFDSAAFPATAGKVLCRFSEARNETAEALSFSNTYEFFRKTLEGTWLHLTIQETSRTTLPADPTQPAAETVADTRQELAVIPEIPPGASEHPEVSLVIAYVLDHRSALVESGAGRLAQRLNYSREGKIRLGNYVQPRVAFLEQAGSVCLLRVYGLEALMTGNDRSGLEGGQILENRVLELSVDEAGAARVALVPLPAPLPPPAR